MGVFFLKQCNRRTVVADRVMSFSQVRPNLNRKRFPCIDGGIKGSKCGFNCASHWRNNDKVWLKIHADDGRFLISSFRKWRVREGITAMDVMQGLAMSNDTNLLWLVFAPHDCLL